MNNRVRLNTGLLTTLSDVLFIPSTRLTAMTSIPTTTWYRIMADPKSITVQQLLAIANGLSIPVKRFFSSGKVDIIGKRDDYVSADYKPCYYNNDELQNIISSSSELTWKQAAEATGISYYNLRNSLLAERRTPVMRFLTACEALDIDPFTILIDPNKEIKHKDKSCAAEITALKEQIADLTSTIDSLTAKYKALLDRHNRLENNVRDYLGDDPDFMVADDEK